MNEGACHFYMYRAQSRVTFEWGSMNLGTLPGVLKYLHTEIVPMNHPGNRLWSIDRILRFSVLVRNPGPTCFAKQHVFAAFDSGRCTVPACASRWASAGYFVGCQTQGAGSIHAYEGAVWYSVPGPCPSREFRDETEACRAAEPGGRCRAPDGSPTCTWELKLVGHITLDELAGIGDYRALQRSGGREYDPATDRGVGTSFWDGARDRTRCAERVAAAERLFHRRYPSQPQHLPTPACLN